MSSKSKKQKPVAPAGPAAVEKSSQGGALLPAHKPVDHDDELIHAPRGHSPLRYALMIALMIFLLVIFLVPDALFGWLGGGWGSGSRIYLRWEHPSTGAHEVTQNDFYRHKKSWAEFFELRGGGRNVELTDDQVAGLLILDERARRTGVLVSDAEVQGLLIADVQSIGGVESYKAFLAGRGGARNYEETLRTFLRINRYLALMGFLGSPATPERIEELWHEQHRELSFEYGELATERFAGEALTELPDDAGLQAWFDALSAPERNRHRSPERFAAEQLRLAFAGFDSAALLARFPTAADADPEAKAKEYYDRVYSSRFRNDPPADIAPEALATFEYWQPFETAREQCLAEAPLYFALVDFAIDLAARAQGGETLDLAAEAAALGLAYDPGGVTRSHEEWRELPTFGGAFFATRVARQDLGQVTDNVIVEKDALILARLQERVDPALPPFAELREELAKEWVEERSGQLTVAALAAVRASFTEGRADAAAFDAALEGLGIEVQTTDWKDRADPTPPAADAPAFARFLAANRYTLYELEPAEVAEPDLDTDGERAFLVRCSGAREVGIESMKPLDLANLTRFAEYQVGQEFMLDAFAMEPGYNGYEAPRFSPEALRAHYGVEFLLGEEGAR